MVYVDVCEFTCVGVCVFVCRNYTVYLCVYVRACVCRLAKSSHVNQRGIIYCRVWPGRSVIQACGSSSISPLADHIGMSTFRAQVWRHLWKDCLFPFFPLTVSKVLVMVWMHLFAFIEHNYTNNSLEAKANIDTLTWTWTCFMAPVLTEKTLFKFLLFCCSCAQDH